ncbi:MAG: tagaturonate epimerase family protein, partial [Spirochaetaceae bacterium]|nr:tagaturonate epimerase family protein [Spirochaetaceae bacterium]
MHKLERFSIGTGDRFGMEGEAQIAAFEKAKAAGVSASIVWNKSNREHKLIGTEPADQRAAADRAIAATGWKGSYFVDADHIGLATVDRFAPHCDFFTIDVADFIGEAAPAAMVDAFVARRGNLVAASGLPAALDAAALRAAASRYLIAVAEAAKVYRRIAELRGAGTFAVEVSMDETADPQSPAELAVILAALADEGVSVATIAPKFSGRFNKGVDYVGDVAAFLKEFEADVKVALWAPKALGLPEGLKLSVHSGSDKFSLYPGIGEIVRRLGAGLHLKTAGTTWLEEIVGLAEAGGAGLAMAKEIYRAAYSRYDELVAPYAPVVDIDRAKLPTPDSVERWDSAA